MSDDTARFAASFKKTPGTLSLTKTHVAWNPTAAGAMDRQQQALNRVTSGYRLCHATAEPLLVLVLN